MLNWGLYAAMLCTMRLLSLGCGSFFLYVTSHIVTHNYAVFTEKRQIKILQKILIFVVSDTKAISAPFHIVFHEDL